MRGSLSSFSHTLQCMLLPWARRHPQLAFFTMDILVGSAAAGAGGSATSAATAAGAAGAGPGSGLVFLYRLAPGYCAPSFGIHCAQVGPTRLGLSLQVSTPGAAASTSPPACCSTASVPGPHADPCRQH